MSPRHVVAWPWWLWLIGMFFLFGILSAIATALLYAAIIVIPVLGAGYLVQRSVERNRNRPEHREPQLRNLDEF